MIAPEHAMAVVGAILRAAGPPHIDQQRTIEAFSEFKARATDRTAPERQRRYRDWKRNGITAVTDSDRDMSGAPLLPALEPVT